MSFENERIKPASKVDGDELLGPPSPFDIGEPDLGTRPQRSLGRNAFETIVFRGAGLPLSFAVSVVTSRFLEPAGRGAFVLALLSVTMAAAIFGSIGTAVSREFDRAPSRRRVAFVEALLTTIAVSFPVTIVLAVIDLALAQPGYRRIAFVAVALLPILVTQTVSGALLALGRLRLWNGLQLLSSGGTLVGMLVFVVLLSKGVTGAVFAWTLAQGIVGVVAVVGARDLWLPLPKIAWAGNRAFVMLVYGVRLGLVNLLSLINYRIELIILQLYAGLHAVGIYSLAVSLGELVWLGSSAVAAALVAPMVTGEVEPAAGLVARAARNVLVLAVIGGTVLASAAPFLVPPLFGSEFRASVAPLLVLIPGIVLFAPGSTIANFFSIKVGKARYSFWMTALSAAATAVAAVIAIPRIGVLGAALASTVGYAGTMLVVYWWFCRLTSMSVIDLLPHKSDLIAYRTALAAVIRR